MKFLSPLLCNTLLPAMSKYILKASATQQGYRTLTMAYSTAGMVNVTIWTHLVFLSGLLPI